MENICVKKIKKYYEDIPAIEDISFELKPGKVYGLMGENGAGKTTIMKILCGLIQKDSGNISENNVCIGALIEEPAAYGNLTAKENLKIFRDYTEKKNEVKIDTILKVVGLEENKTKFSEFSVGMKKRLGIAIALLNDPDFLILDEPSCGLDISGIMEIRKMIKEFMNTGSKIVLISSHDTRDLVELCDEIIIIHKGMIRKIMNQVEKDSLKLEKIYLQAIKEK